LSLPVLVTALAMFLNYNFELLSSVLPAEVALWTSKGLQIVCWLLSAFLLNRVLDVFI
jgi:hypothetical protein